MHGEGPDLQYLKNKYSNHSNIIFTGKYNYNDISKFYVDSDFVWAAYPSKDYNVKYAISNKFHESIQYLTPCIYAEETMLGDYVKEKNIGLTVDPYNTYKISSLLDKIINPQMAFEIKRNLNSMKATETLWNEEVKGLINAISKF